MHIVNDLDAWLQARPLKPSIQDPSGSGVTFDHRWGQATYAYFRDRIHVHAAQMQDAYDELDKDASVRKWQEVFGEGFTAPRRIPVRICYQVPALQARSSDLSFASEGQGLYSNHDQYQEMYARP